MTTILIKSGRWRVKGASTLVTRFKSSGSFSHYDIVIAGGGMVGTSLACTLGKNPMFAHKRVLLLEGSKEFQRKASKDYSNRVSALNPATYQLLNKIGAWKHIEGARVGLVKRMQIWDGLSDVNLTFENDNLATPVAYVVENDVVLDAVQKEVKEVENVKVSYEAKIQDCELADEENPYVRVSLANGARYTCNLLLGCDGASSKVRQSLGMHWVKRDYNHMSVVATLHLPPDSENVVAWQRHLPDSTFIALLPLSKERASMVWSTNVKEAQRLGSLPDDQFVDAVNEALRGEHLRSGVVDEAVKKFDNLVRFLNLPSSSQKQVPPTVIGCDGGSRASFPLAVGHATNYVGKGVALVGDAAHRIHPLAGQGVNLGFGDVIALNKVLETAIYDGSNLDSLLYLKEYETERQRHNVPMLLVTHGLWNLYGSQFTPLVLLRSLGMQATQALSPLKRFMISQASGQPLSS